MSSLTINNVNQVISQKSQLVEFLLSEEAECEFSKLEVNWNSGEINSNCKAANILSTEGYTDGPDKLSKKGLLFLSRFCIDLEANFEVDKVVSDRYFVEKLIKIGKNSATFLIKHKILLSEFVLKVIRPGASEDIIEAIRLLSDDDIDHHIVKPVDYLTVEISDIFQGSLYVECIIFPFVKGKTLRQFLGNSEQPINSHAVVSFIKQVGLALRSLEKKGAYHGDLHEDNIIVNYSESSALTFNIIDVSFNAMGSLNSDVCHDNDLTLFRQHLWRMLSVQQAYLKKMSIRKHLGSQAFIIISTVMSSAIKSFKDVAMLIEESTAYENYLDDKKKFLEEKFSPPSFFKLQRYEEITDPTVALELFVPFPELMDKVREFANVFISGNRGSGKSTYLAALGFFPKAKNKYVDFKDAFGIYFPCRMGEFRLLAPELYTNKNVSSQKLKQILIIKIVRRTLEILSEATLIKRIKEPYDYKHLRHSLEKITRGREVLNIDRDVVSEIQNFASTLTRFEMKEIDNLYNQTSIGDKELVINENILLDFFKVVKSSYSELSNTQFHLLFDDAGQPHIPIEVQYVLNDLILSSNPVYCIKLSAEKLTYSTKTSTEKVIENGHDYFDYDISAILFIGAKTTGLDQADLENYFRQIVNKRLEHFVYSSNNIVDYLGDDLVKNSQLINSLAAGRRNAYYFGWSLVWKIADRTPRNLLELVGEIFAAAEILKESPASLIHARTQDRAIRIVSEKRLHSLNHIPGVISCNGSEQSIGRLLFDVTSSIGSTFRIYLKEERGKKRKRQTLAIERNENIPLGSDPQKVLDKLVTYGVLDNTKLDFARDDRVKKPIYVLNRIFCPAFGISPQRDIHLRLSKVKFEELLITPSQFLKDGTKKLRTVEGSEPVIPDLFEGLDD